MKEEPPGRSNKQNAKLILGDVIEKVDDAHSKVDRVSELNVGFPKACRIDRSVSMKANLIGPSAEPSPFRKCNIQMERKAFLL